MEVKEQCKRCFHFQVCANVLKQQLFAREIMLKEENPKCEHYIPTEDVVLVVRCKDCKYYKAQKQSVNWKNKKKYCCRVVALKVNENDYCSYGERKCE